MVLNYILEDLYDADHYNTRYYDGYAEIYINPNDREIRNIATAKDNEEKSVRMGLDSEGNLFAWHYKMLHDDMEKELDKKFILRFLYNYPEKFVWLGSGTMVPVWNKFGTDEVTHKLEKAISGLQSIKYPDAMGADTAWEKK